MSSLASGDDNPDPTHFEDIEFIIERRALRLTKYKPLREAALKDHAELPSSFSTKSSKAFVLFLANDNAAPSFNTLRFSFGPSPRDICFSYSFVLVEIITNYFWESPRERRRICYSFILMLIRMSWARFTSSRKAFQSLMLTLVSAIALSSFLIVSKFTQFCALSSLSCLCKFARCVVSKLSFCVANCSCGKSLLIHRDCI